VTVEDERFAEFVHARSPALLRTACFLTGNPTAAEDLVQTALVKAYAARSRIRDQSSTEAYVRTTCCGTTKT
jgi:DNA-directed RNA polymerase specialized sigma24 family protein